MTRDAMPLWFGACIGFFLFGRLWGSHLSPNVAAVLALASIVLLIWGAIEQGLRRHG